MLMAIIAAILVVAAGVVVYSMHSSSDKPNKDGMVTPGTGSGSDVAVAAVPPPSDSAPDEATTNAGSQQAHTAAATPEHVPGDNPASKKQNECLELQARKKWQDLLDCGKALSQLGIAKGEQYQKVALGETKNERTAAGIAQKLASSSLREVQTALKNFPTDSVYFHDLSEQFEKMDIANVKEETKRANGFLLNHNCDGLKRMLGQETGSTGTERAIAVVNVAIAKCNAEKPVAADATPARPPGKGSATVATPSGGTPPVQPKCDQVDDWVAQALNQYNSGYAQAALSLITKAIACKSEVRLYRVAALYACAAHDSAQAKLYFAKIPPAFQPAIEQKCQQEHTDLGITPQ